MGINQLWNFLTPYAEIKPISILRDKQIAVDFPSLLNESIGNPSVVAPLDQHLRNLFHRVSYLLMERVYPIFLLGSDDFELAANAFNWFMNPNCMEIVYLQYKPFRKYAFSEVLQKSLQLLNVMNVQIITVPGYAAKYCSYLYRDGLVDGILSNNSDCFAYGAPGVYKNISLSCGPDLNKFSGHVEYYNFNKIYQKHDIGPNKAIVLALLHGCDLCSDCAIDYNIESIWQFITFYKEREIHEHICCWRRDEQYELWRECINDANICGDCGHVGRIGQHKNNGCGVCNTRIGCKASPWKDIRFHMLLELIIRKKALEKPGFPNEKIIMKYLKKPTTLPVIVDTVCRPNILLFISYMSVVFNWTKSYSFWKFFPLLTRTHVWNSFRNNPSSVTQISPKKIIKRKTILGTVYLQVMWQDKNSVIAKSIPNMELPQVIANNKNALCYLWTTFEPLDMMKVAYPSLVETYLKKKKAKMSLVNTDVGASGDNLSINSIEKTCSYNLQVSGINGEETTINITVQLEPANGMVLNTQTQKNVKLNVKEKKGSEKLKKKVSETNIQQKDILYIEKCNTLDFKVVHAALTQRRQVICYGPTPEYNIIHLVESNRICCRRTLLKRDKSVDDLDIFAEKRRILMLYKRYILFLEKPFNVDDNYDQMWLKLGWDPKALVNILKQEGNVTSNQALHDFKMPEIELNINGNIYKTTQNTLVSDLFVAAYKTVLIKDVFEMYLEKNLYARDLMYTGKKSSSLCKLSLTTHTFNQS